MSDGYLSMTTDRIMCTTVGDENQRLREALYMARQELVNQIDRFDRAVEQRAFDLAKLKFDKQVDEWRYRFEQEQRRRATETRQAKDNNSNLQRKLADRAKECNKLKDRINQVMQERDALLKELLAPHRETQRLFGDHELLGVAEASEAYARHKEVMGDDGVKESTQ